MTGQKYFYLDFAVNLCELSVSNDEPYEST